MEANGTKRHVTVPGHALVRRLLAYPRNILAAFLGFLALLAILGFLLISERNAAISVVQKERQGVAYIERLRETLRHVQQHRGMALLFVNGNQSARARLMEKQSIIDETFFALNGINQRVGANLGIGDHLPRLERKWATLKERAFTMTAAESFDIHSELTADLIALNSYIVDASGLIQEPSLDGYYMVDVMGIQVPSLTERIGQLRALGAHEQAAGTDMANAHVRLVLGLERVEARNRRLEYSLENILKARPDLQVTVGDPATEAKQSIEQFSRLIRQMLRTESPAVDGQTVFDSGTRAIDDLFALCDHVSPVLDALLQSRLERLQKQRLIAIGGFTAVMLVFIYLLTARFRLEQMVEERTRNLKAINRELESFSYSVSHDLRAPLRAINAFSQILEDEQSDRLDGEGRHYLERIRASTLRMSQLIDGLLELGKVHRSEIVAERVDLTAIARDIASELQESEPGRQVRFEIASGLTALGDAKWLQILLQNLFENAWKFTVHQPDARIEFAAETDAGGVTRFYVRDNGEGFDAQFAHKLFMPFERLHDEPEFVGTGIGLATVRRIVERHGGQVWAEGMPGEGATFYFTIAATKVPYRRLRGPS